MYMVHKELCIAHMRCSYDRICNYMQLTWNRAAHTANMTSVHYTPYVSSFLDLYPPVLAGYVCVFTENRFRYSLAFTLKYMDSV